MNKVILIGNITRDPELRATPSGVSICNFTVAVNRKYANQQTGQRESDFINCIAWRQTGEFVNKYFAKGSKIGLTGSLQTRSYDAQDGSKRYVTEVLVDDVEFVTPKSETSGQSQKAAAPVKNQSASDMTHVDTSGFTQVEDDDLPFDL